MYVNINNKDSGPTLSSKQDTLVHTMSFFDSITTMSWCIMGCSYTTPEPHVAVTFTMHTVTSYVKMPICEIPSGTINVQVKCTHACTCACTQRSLVLNKSVLDLNDLQRNPSQTPAHESMVSKLSAQNATKPLKFKPL
jgi:hypothetical protein